jgi:hypothetical protein
MPKPKFSGEFVEGTKGGSRGGSIPVVKLQMSKSTGWGDNPDVISYKLAFNSKATEENFKANDRYTEISYSPEDRVIRIKKFPSENFRTDDRRYSIQRGDGYNRDNASVNITFPKSLVYTFPQISKMMGTLTVEWYDNKEIYLSADSKL